MRYCLGAILAAALLPGATWADEDAAVKAIQKLGGFITRDNKQPGKPVVGVSFGGPPQLTDAGLKELKEFSSSRR